MSSEDLFSQNLSSSGPLAQRMRPRTLDEFVGQEEIVGKGRLLRRAIEADKVSSLILYGPSGTGKTSLASIIARMTHSEFVSLNALLDGKPRAISLMTKAREDLHFYGRKTILFIDEIHRWNKGQQDALLPFLEEGSITLVGATTESPFFHLTQALISRSRVFRLKSLSEDDLRSLLRAALSDKERGYGALKVSLLPEAEDHLLNICAGDARSLLNALELAVQTTPAEDDGVITIDLDAAQQSIQKKAVLYDKDGDYHYDTVSAFIKSLRGSDPDAALYWLARMRKGGEDPSFIFRRMMILAGEDIGLAEPRALGVVVAAAQAFDRVGFPEGDFFLTEAALFLATAPKSNSSLGYYKAYAVQEKEEHSEVPSHLRDPSLDKGAFGDGKGYLYPHAFQEHWVQQQYLPHGLSSRVFYTPSDQGYERQIRDKVLERREQLLLNMEESGAGEEAFASSKQDGSSAAAQLWRSRSAGEGHSALFALRDKVCSLLALPSHLRVLTAADPGALFLFAMMRSALYGHVAALCSERELVYFQEIVKDLNDLEKPLLLLDQGNWQASLHPEGERDLIIVSYGHFGHKWATLVPLLAHDGLVVSVEKGPTTTTWGSFLSGDLAEQVQKLEKEFLERERPERFPGVPFQRIEILQKQQISPEQVRRALAGSYGELLKRAAPLEELESAFLAAFKGKTVEIKHDYRVTRFQKCQDVLVPLELQTI